MEFWFSVWPCCGGPPAGNNQSVPRIRPWRTRLDLKLPWRNRNGKFRFLAVAPGKIALKVDWSEVTSAGYVTWQVSWEPGPMMAVSRNVP